MCEHNVDRLWNETRTVSGLGMRLRKPLPSTCSTLRDLYYKDS